MRKALALLTVMATVVTLGPARADEHVVSLEAARARLATAGAQRERDTATLVGVLSSPAATAAARGLGVDLSRVEGAVPTLGSEELRDLAARAEALRSDPAAGLSHDVEELLVIFLIVAIVLLVIKAVD